MGIVYTHINTHTLRNSSTYKDMCSKAQTHMHKNKGMQTETQTFTNIYVHIYTSYPHRYTQTPRITRRSQDQGTEHKSHCPGPKQELGCQEDLSLESYRPRLWAQHTLVMKSFWEHFLSMQLRRSGSGKVPFTSCDR